MIDRQASFQPVHVWSIFLDLMHQYKIIIPLNLSVELFRCSYHLMPLLGFFPWLSTDTHITFLVVHRILRWIIIWLILHIQKPSSSSLDTNRLWWVISSTLIPVLYFLRCTPYFRCLVYCFVKYPDGWYLYLHHLCEPRNFYGSYSTGVTPDKIPSRQLHRNQEVNWKVMHWRSGSRPWTFVFMPMDTM